jgi:2-polyprenyl-6-methoxyphenol hydroxylase-like FAD-dependent oxidoreductase
MIWQKKMARFTARRTSEDKILKVVIVGAGEVGFHIARRLAIENRDVVLVDKDFEALRRKALGSDLHERP